MKAVWLTKSFLVPLAFAVFTAGINFFSENEVISAELAVSITTMLAFAVRLVTKVPASLTGGSA